MLRADILEKNAFGVDITILGGGVNLDDFTNPADTIGELAGGTSGAGTRSGVFNSTPGNAVGGNSTVQFGFISGSVQAFIRALDDITDTTVLANPEVLVLNRQRADLLVGSKLGYVSTTQTETSATQTVEFLDVGTQLTVRPFISSDGMIRMELRPATSTGGTRVEGGFIIPETETQELTTNVMVKNGQTIVIGGLFEESTTVARKQVPGVGDLPVIGAAFKGHDDTVDRSEIIFLITPVIVKDEDLNLRGKNVADGADLVMYGARQALLPWSRTKLEASHMNDAQRYLKEGDEGRAMLAARAALNVNSTNVDARRMLMKLSNEHYKLYNRSLLNESITEAINAHVVKSGAKAQPWNNEATSKSDPLPDDSQNTQVVEENVGPDATASTETDLPEATGVTSDDVPQNRGTSHQTADDPETAALLEAVEDLFRNTEKQSDNNGPESTQTAGVETDD